MTTLFGQAPANHLGHEYQFSFGSPAGAASPWRKNEPSPGSTRAAAEGACGGTLSRADQVRSRADRSRARRTWRPGPDPGQRLRATLYVSADFSRCAPDPDVLIRWIYSPQARSVLVVMVPMGPERWGPDSEDWVIHLNRTDSSLGARRGPLMTRRARSPGLSARSSAVRSERRSRSPGPRPRGRARGLAR